MNSLYLIIFFCFLPLISAQCSNGTCIVPLQPSFGDDIILSDYTFVFENNNYIAITNGSIRIYDLINSTFVLNSTLNDSSIYESSSVYHKGNKILVSNPQNDTSFVATLWRYQLIWTIEYTFTQEDGGISDCTNVGKSVLILSNLKEIVLGGDTCTLFYQFDPETNWEFNTEIEAGSNDLVIGNSDNFIMSSTNYPGFEELGDYFVNNFICRNTNESSWGYCFQIFNNRGNMNTKTILCDNTFGFQLIPSFFASYYDVSYFTYDTSDEVWNVYASEVSIASDDNAIVSPDCQYFVYNQMDTDTWNSYPVIMQFNATTQTYVQLQQFNTSAYSSEIDYFFSNNELVLNVQNITSLLTETFEFPPYNFKKDQLPPIEGKLIINPAKTKMAH